MQIFDPADLTCCCIEQLGRDGLGERVALPTVHLISTHEVVTFDGYHLIEFGNLIGTVLQVGIHCDDYIAFSLIESAVECRTLAVVATELNAMYFRILGSQLLNDVPRVVGGAVVAEDDFVAVLMFVHHTLDPCVEFCD